MSGDIVLRVCVGYEETILVIQLEKRSKDIPFISLFTYLLSSHSPFSGMLIPLFGIWLVVSSRLPSFIF